MEIDPSPSSGATSDSSSSSSNSKRPRSNEEEEVTSNKKNKFVFLPRGFPEPMDSIDDAEILAPIPLSVRKPDSNVTTTVRKPDSNTTTQLSCIPYSKQFWKAGDYEDNSSGDAGDTTLIDGMDHVRVHPRFLHSNATSHKWVLGAVAELLDNSIDEVNNGATYCNIDMVLNKKDGSRMLLVEDNGGGMSPGTMRHCMSLGYSAKSKLVNTIGQYGNGFKTSTMRVGADVIVFSRCPGKDGGNATQSIGLLSYTFLTSTGKEDIVVPMLDYEKKGNEWSKIVRSSSSVDWNKNVDTIVQWSPYASEADLLEQFNYVKDQGTRIVIYNLWEEEEGALELDFDSDKHDIQIRGVNRDDAKIQMAKDYPKSKQCLTFTHSLRSYASILYLKPPTGFRIILRGQDVVHHNMVNNMFMIEDFKYKPSGLGDIAKGKMGFHMDAKAHLDIQGFNVYHRNRLIKPFWRVWNTPSSGGRGVIGVLEANFVKPAHDKQDFECTGVLSKLETKLAGLQKHFWNKNKVAIGYGDPKKNDPSSKSAPAKAHGNEAPRNFSNSNSLTEKITTPAMDKCNSRSIPSEGTTRETLRSAQTGEGKQRSAHMNHESSKTSAENGKQSGVKPMEKPVEKSVASITNEEVANPGKTSVNNLISESREHNSRTKRTTETPLSDLKSKQDRARVLEDQTKEAPQADAGLVHELRKRDLEIRELKRALELEKEKSESLEAKLVELNKEQEAFINIFSEERTRRDASEEKLRNKVAEEKNKVKELEAKLENFEKNKSKPT
ncbi:hypothetical protein MKW94_018561 [Papaver nudicaule]|uniref:Morc S5 domain-containing protein n=1 Tax=Papaver nudicaule TaxID=74823 RepID=A0AA41VIG2_PAPNU|nr:hypothetical protein [Papaver nudicaule]